MAPLSSFLASSLVVLILPSLLVSAQFQEPVIGQPEDEASCHNACTALVEELGHIVQYEEAAALKAFSKTYFSANQREIIPACGTNYNLVVRPQSTKHVSRAVRVIREHACPFAIKSGGHAASAGFSNVDGGITIDLKMLNEVEYLGEKDWDGTPVESEAVGWSGRITRVGPGNNWLRVCETLEKDGMAVVGGRSATVGVGGFLLGGGISFISHERGWGVDNVRNFELVLPNGTITNVNHASNPELFSALRGGGNNFGIVTRFDLETFPQGPVWGGYVFWFPSPAEVADRKLKMGIHTKSAFTFDSLTRFPIVAQSIANGLLRLASRVGRTIKVLEYTKAIEAALLSQDVDVNAHFFGVFSYVRYIDAFLFGGQMAHTKGVVWPAILKPFKDLNKPLYQNSRISNTSSLLEEIDGFNDNGHRQYWNALTLRATPASSVAKISLHQLLGQVFDIFIQEVEAIKAVDGIVPSVGFHPINLNDIRGFQKNGGNAIGIQESEGPLLIMSFFFSYDPSPRIFRRYDALVRKAQDNVYERTKKLAEDAGLFHPFQYMNYADGKADVFEGYGKEKREWLRRVKKDLVGDGRWDVGGFKV